MAERNSIMSYPDVKINFQPEIPTLIKIKEKTQVDVRYCLIEPFAFAHVYWDSKISEMVYDIEEPTLNPSEQKQREILTEAIRSVVNISGIIEGGQEVIIKYLNDRFRVLAVEVGLDINYESYQKIFYYLCRDFIGFNEVEPLLRDYYVEDIECNGADTPIYIVHREYRNLRTNVEFDDNEQLASFVEKLAQRSGKYISYANPILDATLPDGSRINATYTQDITSRGPTFTVRKFTKTPWTPTQLLSFKTLSPEMLAYLWLLVEHKMNILISGGTASGKTTLLNAMAFFIPPEARVVSIEDTREINIPRENWLPSVVRTSTKNNKSGEITLFDLLKNSFRQTPDYVIVGEVRGKEAYVLFQGMASGHSSISTIHADSVDSVIKRLETPPIELSPTLLNVLDCVCIMTHAIVNKKETRKLKEITEIINVSGEGVANTNTPFVWNPANDTFYFKKNSKIFEKIGYRFGIPADKLQEEFRRRSELLFRMQGKNVFGFEEVQTAINEYYKNPEKILQKFGIK